MRKDIKRTKIHLIHKFTRNVKTLRRPTPNEEKMAKSLKKAEIIVKKIKHLKEVEPDDVSRFALKTKTDDVKKLLADIKIPMKSQVMAIITLHKFVATAVENFRKQYLDWNKNISSLLKKTKKKKKLTVETNGSINKNIKVSNKLKEEYEKGIGKEEESSDNEYEGRFNVRYSESEEENHDNNRESEEENDEDNSEGEEETVNSSEDENFPKKEERRGVSISDRQEESESEQLEDQNSSEEDDFENSIQQDSENEQVLSSNEESQNYSDTGIVKPAKSSNMKSRKRHSEAMKPEPSTKRSLTDLKNVVRKNVKEHKTSLSKNSLTQKVRKEAPKVVDPFFITTANEEYLTNQVPKFEDNNDSNKKNKFHKSNEKSFNKFSDRNSKPNWNSNQKDNWKQNRFNKPDFKQNKNPSYQKFDKPPFNSSSNKPMNSFTNRKERRKALHQPMEEKKAEKLHPSWEAKKKQSSIAVFQGKKITFD